jgi:integrase/recombinase XerD
MSRTEPQLMRLMESFFREHLQRVRGASPRTVASYRDALRLFVCFLADDAGRPASTLTLDDIVGERVLGFLDHLERERKNGVATRNQRLAAVRCFAEHLLRNDPARAGQYRRILDIPTKKARRPTVTYLEPEEVAVLLSQPDRRSSAGQAHYALLLFLYNTGARISEALAVCMTDMQFRHPSQVRLHGKGNKDRFCPLWPETVTAIDAVNVGREPARRLFQSARGVPLTRDGAAYLLRKYATQAEKEAPTLINKRVTPHVLRHSCAVALLQAGMDVTVIRDYLGHVSVSTTSRYISTNLEMKRNVLDAFWKRAGLGIAPSTRWQPTADVLAFLDSL